jgi:hypothetical protein
MNPNLIEQFLGPSTQFFCFNTNDYTSLVSANEKKTSLLTKHNRLKLKTKNVHKNLSSSKSDEFVGTKNDNNDANINSQAENTHNQPSLTENQEHHPSKFYC